MLAPMPTPAERLATLEAIAQDNRRRLDEIYASINGGNGVQFDQSIRGRLHSMRSAIEAADKLADAATELRRIKADSHRSRIKVWQWSVIALCSVATAAAPYVLLLAR